MTIDKGVIVFVILVVFNPPDPTKILGKKWINLY